jgi:8-oxo-dGTP diphosphatase
MNKVKVVAVYIEDDDKILMVQERGQAQGLWSIPLGHVESGESLREAAKREVKEETGYLVNISKSLGKKIVSDTDYKGGNKDKRKIIEVNFFKGKIASGTLSPNRKSLLDAKWIEKNKILNLPLRGSWLRAILS